MAEHRLRRPGASASRSTAPASATTERVWGGEFLRVRPELRAADRQLSPVSRCPAATRRSRDPRRGWPIAYAADAGCLDAALDVLARERAAAAERVLPAIDRGLNAPLDQLGRPAVRRGRGADRRVPTRHLRGAAGDRCSSRPPRARPPASTRSTSTADDGRLTIDTRPIDRRRSVKRPGRWVGRRAGSPAGSTGRWPPRSVALCRLIAMQTDLRPRRAWPAAVRQRPARRPTSAARLDVDGFEVFVPARGARRRRRARARPGAGAHARVDGTEEVM